MPILFFLKIILDLIKRYIRITTGPIIVLFLSLVLKLNKGYRWIYNLSFPLISLVNNIILEKYKILVYTTVITI